MLKPDWKYIGTIKKKIKVLKVNVKEREIDALDLDTVLPFCIDANEKTDLAKIKEAKIYQATVKVFKAEFTPEFERQWVETAKGDIDVLKGLQIMKASGSTPKKYELVSLTP
jgi:hypothetical protein